MKVEIDGVEFAPVSHKENKKCNKSIQDFCRENRCWAAKDLDGGWFIYKNKPELGCVYSGWVYCDLELSKKMRDLNLSYPNIIWDKSLIAPDGSMPLLKKKEKKWQPRRGDPIFVWDDGGEEVPAPVLYFHSFDQDHRVRQLIPGKYNEPSMGCWDHYRKFNPALVGIPVKDWPKEEA